MAVQHSYWRGIAAPIIARVIAEVGIDDLKKLRKALSDAYPFGERRFHPYRIWRDEIKRQLNPAARSCIPRCRAYAVPNPDQLNLLQ